MALRVTTAQPTRCGTTTSGYALHRATITLRGASAEEIDRADRIACAEREGAVVTRDPVHAARWYVRQARVGDRYLRQGGADREEVEALTRAVADDVRAALGAAPK